VDPNKKSNYPNQQAVGHAETSRRREKHRKRKRRNIQVVRKTSRVGFRPNKEKKRKCCEKVYCDKLYLEGPDEVIYLQCGKHENEEKTARGQFTEYIQRKA
jgi:hypothetical protein